MPLELIVGRPALLVIDMQVHFVNSRPSASAIVAPIARLVGAFRAHDLPVIFTREIHRPGGIDGGLESDPRYQIGPHTILGTPEAEIVDGLGLREQDLVVDKRRYNCFLGTELDLLLRALRVETLAITGLDSDVCVHWTSGEAFKRDYHVRVLEDCVAGPHMNEHEASLLILRSLVSLRQPVMSRDILAALDDRAPVAAHVPM